MHTFDLKSLTPTVTVEREMDNEEVKAFYGAERGEGAGPTEPRTTRKRGQLALRAEEGILAADHDL